MPDYYSATSDPADNTDAEPLVLRTEHASIQAGFAKVAGYTGNASKIVAINSAGTAQEAITTTGTGSGVRATSPTLVTPLLGTPTSGVLTNCTGYPASGLAGLGTGVATFLATPSSANLLAAITDETGTGALVFATSPALTTPNIGVATATSVNKVAITAPATSATLTIADGKILTASNTLTLAGTDGSTLNVGTGGTLGTAALVNTGVTAGNVPTVDQTITATTRAATTTLGTSLNHTLSDTSTTITAFNGVAGVTYHCRCLGAGAITHHATDLIITQTGASIAATAAGDTFDIEMITGTTCRLKNFTKADGTAVVAASGTAPVFGRVVLTAGDITTTSTTFVDLTGATITFTTGAYPVAYGFAASAANAASNSVYLDIDIDGTRQGNATNGIVTHQMPHTANPKNLSFAGQSAALTAGSHTIKVQWRVSDAGSAGTIYASSPAMLFWAHEIR